MALHTEGTGTLYSETQQAEITAQLQRLLANPHFSHSKRFPSFLRFVIQEELQGRGDQLKERLLGVVVFGRDVGYDTTADPIVRVTAAEIRKRIAQYYQDGGHAEELRISLPAGSYVPHFAWSRNDPVPAALPATAPEGVPAMLPAMAPAWEALPTPVAKAERPALLRRGWTGWSVAFFTLLTAALLAGGVSWARSRPGALDRFWTPVLGHADSVVVCFPRTEIDTVTLRHAADPEQTKIFQEQTSAMSVDDLQSLVSLVGLLEIRHQHYTMVGQDTATLTDLRRGPTIFVGAFDNAWTLRVTRGLRYRFGNDAGMNHFWIEDTQSPARWQIDRTQQIATNNYHDYAIVARFMDATTGQMAVISAGIARGGTVAAGEFLTEPDKMDALKAYAPRDWPGKNMEVVLSTEIIDGRSAPPRMEAAYFW